MTPQKFKELRGNRTLQELSDLIGISTRGIRYYESGGRAIPKPVQILMKIYGQLPFERLNPPAPLNRVN